MSSELNTQLNLHLIHLTDMKDFVVSELKGLEEFRAVCVCTNECLTRQAIEMERETIVAREEALHQRRQNLEAEKQAFQGFKRKADPSDDDIIDLCVGGTVITTTRATLCRIPGTYLQPPSTLWILGTAAHCCRVEPVRFISLVLILFRLFVGHDVQQLRAKEDYSRRPLLHR